MDIKAPRRRLGRAERERQILDAAVSVFSERGFQQASMDAVAALVGVTKPVLYTHFGPRTACCWPASAAHAPNSYR